MQHILPSRFVKIRHYGFMSNSNRKTKIPLCRSLLNQTPRLVISADSDLNNLSRCHCPKCHGKLILISRFPYRQSIPQMNSS